MKSRIVGALLLISANIHAQTFSVTSPDGRTTMSVTPNLNLQVTHDQRTLVNAKSLIGLSIDSAGTNNWKPLKATRSTTDTWIHPQVPVKFASIRDHYNEGVFPFKNGISLILRAYDNGVAYRWVIHRKGAYKIWKETLHLQFQPTDTAWYPLEDGFYSHNERNFVPLTLDSIKQNKLASLPVTLSDNGTKLFFSEADLYDYAGLWVRGDGQGGLDATWPSYPKTLKETSDRDRKVLEREDYIAEGEGDKLLPWRLLAIEDKDGGLLTNTLVYQLSRGTKEDFSWVQPGKVSWDWWNDNNVYDVDFRAGINTATYKYYIDFAARYGLSYIILDEGWSPVNDILKVVPDLDMQALMDYAKSKNVGVILWVSWLSLDKQLDQALDLYARWGVKGIKVDFMQRDDQLMVNYYEKVAKATAARHMLVDFHGAYKPTGLDRQYPNALTREGVFGNENSKWADVRDPRVLDPRHNVTLAFTRMVAGPMDYTPGAMQNATQHAWAAIFSNPMSKGTRCQQLAMYVVYESPLQMLCDNPTHYYKEPECMDFLSTVPATWDTTVVLQASVSHVVALARRATNGDWYIGAMTDWTPRDLDLDLSFLGGGAWTMDSWQDGINADRNAEDFKRITGQSVPGTLHVHLAPGGGFAARITKAH
ncbi:glycoside hydrolase family 97 protein [Dinghuibacter silviterrae]|uniref:Alpha-glucosidase n=1 Tax=Dinghuibacter silviterrae TaxID=1539049 RepID=A0A4V3GKZ1_9BACT|nr:glycoside hydrolase family 97 protein [Dinghuibacter silviterrae]TDW97532.1 alpha-glucosidase [Dinghuibacter silviterrae]